MLAACAKQPVSVEEREDYWRTLVAKELPPGSSQGMVEAFLMRNGLEYGYSEKSRTFQAIERNVSGSNVVSFSVTLSCPLSSTGILVACVVSSVGTGP